MIRFVLAAALLMPVQAFSAALEPDYIALVGIGCEGEQDAVYRWHEDEFPQPCDDIHLVALDTIPACQRAELAPTDANLEECYGPVDQAPE